MAASKFTDTKMDSQQKPVDFAACAQACFAAPQQGLSNQQLAANLAQMNGIDQRSAAPQR